VSEFIALLLDIRHTANLLAHLPQSHPQIIRPIVEARHAHTDIIRRALNLNSKLLPTRRIANEISNLSRRTPPHELAIRGVVRRCLVSEPRIRFHATFAMPAAQLGSLIGALPVTDIIQLARALRLAVKFELVRLLKVFFALFAIQRLAHGRFLRVRGLERVLHAVFGAEVDIGYAFTAILFYGRKLGLDQALEVGEWLLGVDEEGKGLDVFAVGISVHRGQRQYELQHPRGSRQEFAC
jgi:hypothetical protein